MQYNGMGYAWVTEGENDECSVTEWITPGDTEDDNDECSVTEWVMPGLPRMKMMNAVLRNGLHLGYPGRQ